MRCTLGRVPISEWTARELFARAAGRCQRPECLRDVFVEVGERRVAIGELAHVVGAASGGPRGTSEMDAESRAEVENLVLLCSSCHTLVDKAANHFTEEVLRAWKSRHEQRVNELWGVTEFPSRAEARRALKPLLGRNRAAFEMYGPESAAARHFDSDAVRTWRRKATEIIVPTNRNIMLLVDANQRWLSDRERGVVERLRQHVDDFEARHIHGIVETGTATFPEDAESLFEDGRES